MQFSRTKLRKSFILSTKKWIKCLPGKNPVNSREKSGDITCSRTVEAIKGTANTCLLPISWVGSSPSSRYSWFNFFSNTMMFFSKWLVMFLQVAGVFSKFRPRYVLCTSATWHMYSSVWSYWVQAIIIGCVLCRCAFKMQNFAYGCQWCLHTFFFSRYGGGPCNPVRVALDSPTKTLKGWILQPDVFCYISPVLRVNSPGHEP